VVDADFRGFFDALDREILMALVAERISDRRVLKLLRHGCGPGCWTGKRSCIRRRARRRAG
jgi:retron-type reverse transcriptase